MGFSRQEDWSGVPLPSPGDKMRRKQSTCQASEPRAGPTTDHREWVRSQVGQEIHTHVKDLQSFFLQQRKYCFLQSSTESPMLSKSVRRLTFFGGQMRAQGQAHLTPPQSPRAALSSAKPQGRPDSWDQKHSASVKVSKETEASYDFKTGQDTPWGQGPPNFQLCRHGHGVSREGPQECFKHTQVWVLWCQRINKATLVLTC